MYLFVGDSLLWFDFDEEICDRSTLALTWNVIPPKDCAVILGMGCEKE
jgi:hypothetical protein